MPLLAFTWPHPAQTVHVTGTFDSWSHSLPLEKQPDGTFSAEKEVEEGEVVFKFIVDGVWRVNEEVGTLRDAEGNINNVVRVEASRDKPLERKDGEIPTHPDTHILQSVSLLDAAKSAQEDAKAIQEAASTVTDESAIPIKEETVSSEHLDTTPTDTTPTDTTTVNPAREPPSTTAPIDPEILHPVSLLTSTKAVQDDAREIQDVASASVPVAPVSATSHAAKAAEHTTANDGEHSNIPDDDEQWDADSENEENVDKVSEQHSIVEQDVAKSRWWFCVVL
ncbi:uncharacterized protein SPPG_08343 [Spizellomyces punctatus DAOM BR117]|uniref:AMP-activated protein kinase glycogen-binding domain-containing protein n=1 Tax=Spizellomyces punctatus (strain DAOM BR117) TaxID=645134 RepID=A0A0L0H650_SPIPD|nr:uncharacterized protein SPPG_08343 [Spizellomyces punctatus DAOM BR117]KNC96188.1 hypothetical protein SPPG_08343 [Spizellomyces punctatus DAOM BR117]|eukprot:XP_016604228.1 hypothetical protein SPPG_08343 [Spizellomyces punctatus DAOM BR117]